jgi:hypothetical protein
MAVTRGATVSEALVGFSVAGTDASISHTVDSGTTLLLVSVSFSANNSVSVTPQWSLGGGENLTLVDATTSSGLLGDVALETWGLINPTSGAGTVTVTLTSDLAVGLITFAVNYIGTDTTSVAAATNLLEEDVNDTATNTTTFASAGTAGNCLFATGAFRGADGDGITVPTNFTELMDAQSGTSNGSDQSGYACDQLDGAPDSCTWTWVATDENTAHYIEVVASATDTTIIVPTGPWR